MSTNILPRDITISQSTTSSVCA